jgi:hypothetical protein
VAYKAAVAAEAGGSEQLEGVGQLDADADAGSSGAGAETLSES